MSKKIIITDYGMGNLHSVKNAFEYIGAQCALSSCPDDLESADAVILPGVGAFPDASDTLFDSGYAQKLTKLAKDGMPILGICLGMQLLLEESDEVRPSRGLGLIKGRCEKIRDTGLKIPHIGWNDLIIDSPDCPILGGTKNGEYVYFVHSYKAVLSDSSALACHTFYGEDIPAAIFKDNVFGTQFHPEKSERAGLKILSAFCGYADIPVKEI